MTLEVWQLSFFAKVRLDVTLHTDGRTEFMTTDRDRRPHRTSLRLQQARKSNSNPTSILPASRATKARTPTSLLPFNFSIPCFFFFSPF